MKKAKTTAVERMWAYVNNDPVDIPSYSDVRALLEVAEAAQELTSDDDIGRLRDHWAFPVDEFDTLRDRVAALQKEKA